ncbi:MAG: preprotein translocase subunit SecG [Oscillospiraceae bacterium]|nr:preprotein translocase subunit SecG [Oscillospiraceae bacterium]
MTTLFITLHIIVTILLITIVLVQEGKDPGMRGIAGASSSESDSFFSKNTGRTKKAFMIKVTSTFAVLFLITTIVLVILTASI